MASATPSATACGRTRVGLTGGTSPVSLVCCPVAPGSVVMSVKVRDGVTVPPVTNIE